MRVSGSDSYALLFLFLFLRDPSAHCHEIGPGDWNFGNCCTLDSLASDSPTHPLKFWGPNADPNLAFFDPISRCVPIDEPNFPQTNDFLSIYDVFHTNWHQFKQLISRTFCSTVSSSRQSLGRCMVVHIGDATLVGVTVPHAVCCKTVPCDELQWRTVLWAFEWQSE